MSMTPSPEVRITRMSAASMPADGGPRGAAHAPAEPDPSGAGDAALDQLEQLRFLHDLARLATTARTWDELLETAVDGTRDALHADVSSLYLLDRDGAYLTLGGHQRSRPVPDRPGPGPLRRRRDRPRGGQSDAAGHR